MAVGAGRGLSHVARLPVMSGLFTVRRAQEATRHHQEHRCGSWKDVRRLAALTSHQPKGITMQEQKWEYLTELQHMRLISSDTRLSEYVNGNAKLGWELVGPPVVVEPHLQFYWKRPV